MNARDLITIFGLISAYQFEQTNKHCSDETVFLNWLLDHELQDTHQLIVANPLLLRELKTLFKFSSEEINEKLERLSSHLAALVKGDPSLHHFAVAYAQEFLSAQAKGLLLSIDGSSVDYFELADSVGDSSSRILFNTGLDESVTDPRFLRDDLDLLLNMGFLKATRENNEEIKYRITQAGADFVNHIFPSAVSEMKDYILQFAQSFSLNNGHVLDTKLLDKVGGELNPKLKEALIPAVQELIKEGIFEERSGSLCLTSAGKNRIYELR